MLKLISSLRPAHVERGPQETLANQIQMLGAKVSIAFAVELLQLSEFLCQRHAREQGSNFLFNIPGPLGVRVKWGRYQKDNNDHQNQQIADCFTSVHLGPRGMRAKLGWICLGFSLHL